MIVQCDKCLTKFKISDSKVKGKVVRIRCARCHQPFTVRGEEPEEKKEPTSEAPNLNDAPELNDSNGDLSRPENDDLEAPSLEYNADSATDFSLGDVEDNLSEDTDTGLSAAAQDKTDEVNEDDSTDSSLDLSIDAALGEDSSVEDKLTADPSVADPSVTDEENEAEQALEYNDSQQGPSMELSSDSVLVDGEEVETPDSGDFSPDDFDLDPNDDAPTSEEFIPEDAPPEDIIEDGEDSDEFDLGIGAGITLDPDLEEGDEGRSFESSIEDTLEESGFGFSLGGVLDDTDEDFTKDIDEFPVLQEDEDSEFKTELPDFDSELNSESTTEPGTEPKDEALSDEAKTKTDETKDETEEDEPVTDETDDDFDLPEGSEPENETEDDFGLTEETESESETGGDFGVATEPTPDSEEVFKGFADEPINETCEASKADETSETCEADEDSEPYEAPKPHTSETDTPEEEAPEINTEEPYAREDIPPAEFAEEPIEANCNPQQPLPFETPSSPKPEMTFTPTPQEDDSGEYLPTPTSSGGKKGANSKWLPLIILAIIVYGGIAALYSAAVIGPPLSRTVELSPIRVERIRGVFIENKEMGRIFTIEGRIRNFSEEPQGISMIRGVLEDSQGRVIAAKKVTPGKIISKEALKTITRNELRKKLSGVPGGSIPPKGSIPVMIIFTKLPKGFAGAGVEVYRR
ncbi:hypothetical protein MNBD_DELTA01-937 [hydrothermal vent metagenome]|uniref:Zinc finger/thioredoxin putative domain-containing protein n=1 Tax=hydrothermal vent metagenome TaxID=652676 RepID=A0A3B0R3I4_9ZZZZ